MFNEYLFFLTENKQKSKNLLVAFFKIAKEKINKTSFKFRHVICFSYYYSFFPQTAGTAYRSTLLYAVHCETSLISKTYLNNFIILFELIFYWNIKTFFYRNFLQKKKSFLAYLDARISYQTFQTFLDNDCLKRFIFNEW